MRKNLEIYETRLRLHLRSKGRCEVCNKPIGITQMQMAHKIPSTKYYLKHYGKEIIHNDLNLIACCSLKCNSSVLLDPATHPIEAMELIEEIKESLNE